VLTLIITEEFFLCSPPAVLHWDWQCYLL